nr:NADH dehydrogenase subunit 3 [Corynespora cassiicola]
MTSTTFFIIFVPILGIILLAVNLLLAPHNPYQEKDSVFECGFHSFLGQNRTQFSVSFFIFAILFLLFDLEIVLIYPYSVSGYSNDIYGLIIMMVFFVLLTLGFIFELGKNALTIDSKQTVSYTNTTPPKSHVFIQKLLLQSTFLVKPYLLRMYTNYLYINVRILIVLIFAFAFLTYYILDLTIHNTIYVFYTNVIKDFTEIVCSLCIHFLMVVVIKYGFSFVFSYIHWDKPSVLEQLPMILTSSTVDLEGKIGMLRQNRKQLQDNLNEIKEDLAYTKDDLKEVEKTLTMANLMSDSKNNALADIKKKYEHFFDEESGNTTKEGLQQIVEELKDDIKNKTKEYRSVKKEWININKELEGLKTSSQSLCVVQPFGILGTILRFISPYLSIITFFWFISLVLSFTNLIVLPDCIYYIQDFITNMVEDQALLYLFLLFWYVFTFFKKLKRSIGLTKPIVQFFFNSEYADYLLFILFLVAIFFLFLYL